MKPRQRPSIFSGRNEGVPGGESSDSSSGPEQTLDEDADMMMNADDSNTSIGDLVGFKRMTVSPSSGVRLKPYSPIYTLPPELLIAIFRKLSSPVDWRNTMLVSRQWASLAVELLWQRPYFCEFKNYQAMVMAIESKNAFFDYPQLIRRLNLTFIADKINNGSLIPLQKCTRLERVTLTNCTNLTDSPLKDILAANPRIQALDLSQLEGITDETLLTVAENCPRLQGLNLMGCKGITDASLIPLSKNRRILRRVSCFFYLLRGGCVYFEPP
jgi:F-box and leucine-rich repeat protein GRR1